MKLVRVVSLIACLLSLVWPASAQVFFSEYIEGSSYNKALEIYNGTGASLDLSAYSIDLYVNGGATPSKSVTLHGMLANNEVYVIAHPSANAAILAQADVTDGNVVNFNGDDTVVLKQGTIMLDVIGQVGVDPGSEWGTGNASTADNTLRRKASICQGDTVSDDAFNPATEWDGFAKDMVDGLGSHTANCGAPDAAPTVSATIPANGATGIALAADLSVTFSEPVTVLPGWFTISCATSGTHSAVVSGGAQTYTLNPGSDFANNETCTVTIVAANVVDQDGTPTGMAANATFTFTTIAGVTKIHDIQGATDISPMVGKVRTIEGVVVADFQANNQLKGFFVQEEDSDVDADPLTSEGIYVYNSSFAVNVGDVVRVTGTVKEYSGLTEIDSVSAVTVLASGVSLPAVNTLDLPIAAGTSLEPYEGMYVTIPETLTVDQNYFLGRYGQVTLSADGRLYQPTHLFAPGSAEAVALANENSRRMIVLDDGSSIQNPNPIPYIGEDHTIRAGDTVTNLKGVLDFGPISSTSTIRYYRVHPTASVSFTRVNDRTAAPILAAGNVRVASFNLLNYFVTLDDNALGQSGWICGPLSNQECRGANTAEEFTRQRNKTIAALVALKADVIGLMEMENHPTDAALQDLVNGLNAATAAGTYDFIPTGPIGGDAIKVAFIYKPGTVAPVGSFALLTAAFDPLFRDDKSRPALAQTFEAAGEKFTVVANHLKSKGSCPIATDPDYAGNYDVGDGQGCWNAMRTAAATVLANWLATDPTKSGDPDFLVIGDFNSYAKEDPITALRQAGMVNLIAKLNGDSGYSYVYDGMAGYLDQALASPTLTVQVAGVTEWHINADEPAVIDYNTEYKYQDLYTPTPYYSSDHDPVVVSLQLASLQPEKTVTAVDRIENTPMLDVYVGDIFSYTLSIENLYSEAMWFAIQDDLDAILGTQDLNYTTLLGEGETWTVTFDVQVLATAQIGQIINNTAWFTAYTDPFDLVGSTIAIVSASSEAVQVVPEPGTLLLLGSGFISLALFLKRKQR